MENNKTYSVRTAMLIRKPVAEVFEAFINPEITTKFWFTKSSGRLIQGKEIEWSWEMYNHNVKLQVISIVPNQSIVIEWDSYEEKTIVEWTFKEFPGRKTFVTVENSGFTGEGDKLVTTLCDTVSGFTLVLAGAKAYLEHNLQLNLVPDRFPEGK